MKNLVFFFSSLRDHSSHPAEFGQFGNIQLRLLASSLIRARLRRPTEKKRKNKLGAAKLPTKKGGVPHTKNKRLNSKGQNIKSEKGEHSKKRSKGGMTPHDLPLRQRLKYHATVREEVKVSLNQ